MKKMVIYVTLVLFFSCDSEKGWDCLQTSGDILQQEISVAPFSKIIVSGKTQLIISQGESQEITLQTGANLVPEISFSVVDDTLLITNDNTCDFAREDTLTKVFVRVPNLMAIRNASSFPVKSDGVLAFQQLNLFSDELGDGTDYETSAGWQLELDVVQLSVTSNGFARFELSGTAQRAFYGLYAGNSTIEAFDLVTQEVSFFHRSSGDIKVHPVQSIRGTLYSVGNVIANNQPPEVDVTVLFEGALIFQ